MQDDFCYCLVWSLMRVTWQFYNTLYPLEERGKRPNASSISKACSFVRPPFPLRFRPQLQVHIFAHFRGPIFSPNFCLFILFFSLSHEYCMILIDSQSVQSIILWVSYRENKRKISSWKIIAPPIYNNEWKIMQSHHISISLQRRKEEKCLIFTPFSFFFVIPLFFGGWSPFCISAPPFVVTTSDCQF